MKGDIYMERKITNELISDFKTYLIQEEKASNTIEKYIRDVRAFFEWSYEKELTKETVLEYKNHIMSHFAPSSTNSILSSINRFFEYNKWFDLKVKSLKIQRQIFSKKERELRKDEYERLIKAAKTKRNEQLYLLMQTICSCGLRVSELKFITVEALNKQTAIIKCKGKMRQVFLPNALCKLLKRYAKSKKISRGAIFVTKTGKPLDRSNIWKMMKSLCEDAKVASSKVFPHNLRHLFARTYYAIEKDIVRLADILGHSSVNTTRIYTMENGDSCRQQIQRLGLLRC